MHTNIILGSVIGSGFLVLAGAVIGVVGGYLFGRSNPKKLAKVNDYVKSL